MVSKSLVAVKDKSSEPELEGNIRTMVWASASARQAVESEDDQMSPGELAASRSAALSAIKPPRDYNNRQ
jgi:hypothetical protein